MMKFLQGAALLASFCSVMIADSVVYAQDEPAKPFTIVISAKHSEVKSGTSIDLKIVLTNTSGQVLDVSTAYEGSFNIGYEYDIRDGSGRSVQERERKGPLSLSPSSRVLQPHETLQDASNLGRVYDLSQPGAYSIRVSRHISDDAKSPSIESNTITITVVP